MEATALKDRSDAFRLHQGEQLEGGAGGPFLAAFPLSHCAGGDIQDACENGLADAGCLSKVFDVACAHLLDRREA